jgi:polyphosphate kinase
LSRRTEATFPILDRKLKQRVINEALKPHINSQHTYWLDKNLIYKMKNSKGRKLHPNEIAMEEIQ